MSILIVVPKEKNAGELRVALVPETVTRLAKQGFDVLVEEGAGLGACYPDKAYHEAGATIVSDVRSLYQRADLVCKVQPPSHDESGMLKSSSVIVTMLHSHRHPELVVRLRDQNITTFAMELIPRISRAQSMDVLSSQATTVGYKGILIAAELSQRFFPMLTTAAGTIRPARILILGAGVAGLQAIATARRLGAIVEAYDVRRATREQVESLGAKFLQVEMDAESEGGYARELTDEEKQQEQALLWHSVGEADVVVTTAQIPGRDAPCLITEPMVDVMKVGAVIVDLAAESGGNCALTVPGEYVDHKGVKIYGPLNLPSSLAIHASDMYSRNIYNFIGVLGQADDTLTFNWEDEILAGSVVTHAGEIKNQGVRELLERDKS